MAVDEAGEPPQASIASGEAHNGEGVGEIICEVFPLFFVGLDPER